MKSCSPEISVFPDDPKWDTWREVEKAGIEPYNVLSHEPEEGKISYDPEWFNGKSSDEIKDGLSKRHGIPLWRVEEIIEVFRAHRPEWEERDDILGQIKSSV